MATKISALPSSSTLTGAEIIPMVQSSTTKKQTLSVVSAYVASTMPAFPSTVVVIGDSIAQQNTMLEPSWPTLLEDVLRNNGAFTQIINLGIDGHTFYRANTTAYFGSNTAVQAAIAAAPVLVIVALGLNDLLNNFDGRTLTQVKADALTLFAALRAGLPNAKIIYASELCYDSGNYSTPGTTLPNKAVTPCWMELTGIGGVQSGLYCSEQLSHDTGATIRGNYDNWLSLDTYVRALSPAQGHDGSITLNYFRAARLGGTGPDGLHPRAVGSLIHLGYALKGLKAQSWITTLFPNIAAANTGIWNDPDTLFTTVLTASGTDWIPAYPVVADAELLTVTAGPFRSLDPVNWYFPYKSDFYINPTTLTQSDAATLVYGVYAGPPNQACYYSAGGGAWTALSISSDSKGSWQKVDRVGSTLALGSTTLRYKVGNEMYGPLTVTASASIIPRISLRLAAAQAVGATTLSVINYDTTMENIGSGTWSGSAYTIPTAGVYQVDAVVGFEWATGEQYGLLYLLVNGTAAGNSVLEGQATFSNGSTPSYFGTGLHSSMRFAVGDTVAIGVWIHLAANTKVSYGTNRATWLNITWLHP